MTQQVLLVVHELLCVALFISAFCRAVPLSIQTRVEIRLMVLATGMTACVGVILPLWNWSPGWFSILLLTVWVITQAIMDKHWHDQIESFCKTNPENKLC